MRRKFVALMLWAGCMSSPLAAQELNQAIRQDMPSLLEIYRDFHQHPELSMQEQRSAAKLAEEARKTKYAEIPWSPKQLAQLDAKRGLDIQARNGKKTTVKEYEDSWTICYYHYKWLCQIKHPTWQSVYHDLRGSRTSKNESRDGRPSTRRLWHWCAHMPMSPMSWIAPDTAPATLRG